MDPRSLALARAGDVQHSYAMAAQPGAKSLAPYPPAKLDDEERLAVLEGEARGEGRAAVEPAAVDDQRRVRIAHVPLGALHIAARGGFREAVAAPDATVFGDAPARAPAAARDAERPRSVERGTVDPRLPAGDDS